MRAVIFDLDGTLADTSGDLIAAANACFAGLGHPPQLDPVHDAATALRGARAMLALGFSRLGVADAVPLIDAQYPRLLQSYGDNIDHHTTLYPGARESVQALRAQGFAVGICTNKPEALAELLLQRLGIRDLFAALVGADTLPVRKPDPAPYLAAVARAGGAADRSLLVGDTVTDRDTARAAGVPCVLVRFGPAADLVPDLAPDATIGHFNELPAVAARLLD